MRLEYQIQAYVNPLAGVVVGLSMMARRVHYDLKERMPYIYRVVRYLRYKLSSAKSCDMYASGFHILEVPVLRECTKQTAVLVESEK